MPLALLPGGLVILAAVAAVARLQFFDDRFIDGALFPDGAGRRLQSVLSNSVEQTILAAVRWPFVEMRLGGGVAYRSASRSV